MSQLLIQKYLNELANLKKVSGTNRESVVREAFKDLLKSWGKSQDLTFIPEYEIENKAKERRYVDGALLHTLRVPFGYWEAKDEKDDLDAEIEHKFKRGYPKTNILFDDSQTAVLIQHGEEVMRCSVEDTQQLEKLLKLFFGYERPEIEAFRNAVEQFKTDLPAVLEELRAMIERAHQQESGFQKAAAEFLTHARDAINPSLTEADVREMLIQHILTGEVFAAVFPGQPYHEDNNVARELHKLEKTFFTGNTKHQTLKGLAPYYTAIRKAAAEISTHSEKQTFLKSIYENFYKVYNPKAADRLGVVYTPNEIVRFMIESADWLCQQHFGRSLIDKDVDILDPATGTGTFVCELIQHFAGQPEKLKHKYQKELHANEVAILPYYVANLNIEATYAAATGQYEEFPGLCFVDTLDNVTALRKHRGHMDDIFGSVSDENIGRIKRQNSKTISVIIGNPPYNANQLNENENNKNREYPEIDKRIKETYIEESTAQKTKVYDMYARFFRWATDRLDENGVLAMITNRSFVEKRTFDGFRATVAKEFDEIWVVDLGGSVVDNPKLSGTTHNVFGIKTGVAISFMVRKKSTAAKGKKAVEKDCRIFYARRPEMETAAEKLSFVGSAKLPEMKFDDVKPDKTQNWINLSDNDYDSLLPLATKAAKASTQPSLDKAIFKTFSLGTVTARDEWVYGDDESIEEKVRYFADVYNRDVVAYGGKGDLSDAHLKLLSKKIKWTRALKAALVRGEQYAYDCEAVRSALYRPFAKRRLYFKAQLNEMQNLMPYFFPRGAENPSILFTDQGSQKPFMVGATEVVPDYHYVGAAAAAVCVPMYRFEEGHSRVENITDWALDQFRKRYKSNVTPAKAGVQSAGGAKMDSRLRGNDGSRGNDKLKQIGKEDIFHYVYGVLHNPAYREKYALNLKREFPRIPFYTDFWQWAAWGQELMDLHIGYETVTPFALKRTDVTDEKARKAGQSPKALLRADKEKGLITLDSETTLCGIPAEAWNYKLGNRSALEWVLDQYKEKTPKDRTIREKFNTYRFADYKDKVIDLLMRVCTVGVETQRIIGEMRA